MLFHVQASNLSSSSAFYALYEISENGPDDGAVISAQINLSGIDGADLIVNSENPELTITSYSGTGASIRLKTYLNLNGKYIVNGIEVVSNGSGYKDISFDISSSVFANTSIKDFVMAAISVNLDVIDGLNVDPYDVLNVQNVMIDGRIDTNELVAQKVQLPETINLFGVVSNPIEEDDNGNVFISGSELSPFVSKVNNTVTEAAIIFEGDVGGLSPSVFPIKGQATAKNATETPVASTKILASKTESLTPTFGLPNESYVELIGFNYSNITSTSTIVDADNNKFIVNRILRKPKLQQYSGKVLQTTKTTKNIKVAPTETLATRILRINIIRGI
jgi:hypothetical protein